MPESGMHDMQMTSGFNAAGAERSSGGAGQRDKEDAAVALPQRRGLK